MQLNPNVTEDLAAMLRNGMATMGSKLTTVSDEVFGQRLVDIWSVFYGHTLPYLEAVFIPLEDNKATDSLRDLDVAISIRHLALKAFAECIIQNHQTKLKAAVHLRFSSIQHSLMGAEVLGRLSQMLLALVTLEGQSATNEFVADILNALRQARRKSQP